VGHILNFFCADMSYYTRGWRSPLNHFKIFGQIFSILLNNYFIKRDIRQMKRTGKGRPSPNSRRFAKLNRAFKGRPELTLSSLRGARVLDLAKLGAVQTKKLNKLRCNVKI
jgi:hypothetical protein